MRRTAANLLALSGLILVSACGLFGRDRAQLSDEPFSEAEATGPAVPYEVRFEAAVDEELRTALENASAARRDADRPPASDFLLERRAESDVANLVAALHSFGFYEGTVRYELKRPIGNQSAPVDLVFTIEPGPQYQFQEIKVVQEGETDGYKAPELTDLGLERGKPATAQAVLDGQERLVTAAREAGHPFAQPGDLDAVIDRDTNTMDVTLVLRPGARATFAEPSFSGADGIKGRFLRRQVTYRPGEAFDPEQVEETRQALVDTNLFSTVVVREGKELDENGRLPITFAVTQRKHRSIGAGIGYQTDEGPNASLFWENRNLLSGGELLRFSLYGSPLRQELAGRFRKPDVLRRQQDLLGDASIRRDDTDAFQSLSAGAGFGLERRLSKELLASIGIAYRFAQISERDKPEENFALLSLPVRLDWDYSNNLLDPSEGGRVFLTAAPFTNTLGFDVNFFKAQVTATRYFSFLNKPRVVLALRGGLGSIAGADLDEIPADERLYAGGGASVRGFGFQLAGPVDEDDDPVGGRSLFEANAELRFRVTESIGLVTFLDTGSVFDAVLPDPSQELFWGSGIGVRYITPIGPLRLDVGVPLNPRDGVDDPYQVYISIGQAF